MSYLEVLITIYVVVNIFFMAHAIYKNEVGKQKIIESLMNDCNVLQRDLIKACEQLDKAKTSLEENKENETK